MAVGGRSHGRRIRRDSARRCHREGMFSHADHAHARICPDDPNLLFVDSPSAVCFILGLIDPAVLNSLV